MTQQKAKVMLAHLKATHQFFCFTTYGTFHTAEELLAIVEGRKVSFDEAIEFITQPPVFTQSHV